MNKIIKVDDDDDGFGGSIANSRFIRGQILRWSDTGGWSDRDGLRPPEELLVLACHEALRRWKGKRAESITAKPLPDPKELNAAIPVTEWELGIDSKPRPPWEHVAIVHLIEPHTAGMFTYVNSTIGAHIAWDLLREKVRTMRVLRGERVLALVKLSARPMKTTNFGMRTRPEFEIAGWRVLGGGSGNVGGGSGQKAIEGPKAVENCPPETPPAESRPAKSRPAQTKPLAAADATLSTMEEVSSPPLSEDMDDIVRW
jgi:hypothetical protein